jgi:hypothetical protein
MAEFKKSLVSQFTTSTGTGSLTLGSALTGRRTMATAGIANGDTVTVLIEAVDADNIPTGDWEISSATYSTTGPSITSRVAKVSSNANALVSFAAGNKLVHIVDYVEDDQTIDALTADATPDIAADFVPTWDTSASATKKVGLTNLRNTLLGAGSATAGSWPILGSGTLQTTPDAGSLERDANCIYATTDAGNRGVIPVVHWIRADSTNTLTSTTSAQKVFGSPTNGQITLETGAYEFEALINMASMSATSGNATFQIGGTATFDSVLWIGYGRDAAADAATGTLSGSCSRDATLVTAPLITAGTATEMVALLRGTFEVTAGGTFILNVALQTAAAAVVQIGSFLRISRIGSTSMASVGEWD